MRAGDVLEVDFGVPMGSEAGGTRPAVVITGDAVLAQRPRVVQVVPVTTNTNRDYLTDVLVSYAESGLRRRRLR